MKPTLYGVRYSPWSLKARWALDANGVNFDYREYTIMLGEPGLRVRAGRFFGKLSVPVLLKDDGHLFDSFEIATWAATQGESTLFPEGKESEIASWNEWAELISKAGRARVTATVIRDPTALRDSMPSALRGLGPLTTMLGKSGAQFMRIKYGRIDAAESTANLRHYLQAVREALGDRDFLLGDLSYADISVAMALQFVSPVSEDSIRIGDNARRYWTDQALADEFEDLMTWRDRVFEERPVNR